ncbi:MAG: ArsR/SmtB family transcription factor [Planctomycetota bacterium]
MTADSFHRVLKALSDPTRLRLLALLEREELAVGDLMRILDTPQSTVSRHLAVLREAGVLRERREGTFCYCRLELPRSGTWQAAWDMARDALADDPLAAADAQALDRLLEERALASRRWFDEIGPGWDRLRSVFHDDLQRARAIGRLIPRGLRVADIGTGTGILALELARAGVDVVAIDSSPRMLAAASTKLGVGERSHVELREGEATALPLADGEVDAALAHMVLHYVPSPRDAIVEMARVVRPGGRVVVVDFVEDADGRHHDREWMRRDLGMLWEGFEPERIRGWLTAAGLIDVDLEVHGADRAAPDLPATFIASASRAAGPRDSESPRT